MTQGNDRAAEDKPYCPCQIAHGIDQELHDWLLSFESRGMAGVVEIIHYLNGEADSEYQRDRLMWIDFPDFVAMHNWDEPFAVRELANFVVSAIQFRREARPAAVA